MRSNPWSPFLQCWLKVFYRPRVVLKILRIKMRMEDRLALQKLTLKESLQFLLRNRHIFSAISWTIKKDKGNCKPEKLKTLKTQGQQTKSIFLPSGPAAMKCECMSVHFTKIKSPPHRLTHPKGVDPHSKKPLRSHNLSKTKESDFISGQLWLKDLIINTEQIS